MSTSPSIRGTRVALSVAMLASLVTGLLLATPSQAGSISYSYYLDQSNKLSDGINYLQVTISNGDAGAIDFTVKALQPLLDLAGDNFGIQKFAFNVVGGIGAEAKDVDDLPGGWRARNGGRMDGFGLFDIKLTGRGNSRQDPLTFSITGVDFDSLVSYIDLSTGRAPQGFVFFAAHVAGLDLGDCKKDDDPDKKPSSRSKGDDGEGGHHGGGKCVESAYFGGLKPVPAPAAVWLLASGVAAVAGRRLLRKSATA